jgi:hypothetical protein
LLKFDYNKTLKINQLSTNVRTGADVKQKFMMRKIILFLWFAIPVFCMAQKLEVRYEYDASGNRVSRKTIVLEEPKTAPSAPQDSTLVANELEPFTTLMTQDLATEPEYFVEKIAQVEIKIYPNPTTEKITLEISVWENLQTGTFKLFSLTGQLLQEQPVHSATTTVSLAGLPKGTYLLKVSINNRTEDWKIIKQ